MAPAVEQLLDHVEQVVRQGSTHRVVVEDLGHVEANDGAAAHRIGNGIAGRVENPGVHSTRRLAPNRQPRVDPVRARRVEKVEDPGQATGVDLEPHDALQRLIEFGFLAHRRLAARSTHQFQQPPAQERPGSRRVGHLQRIAARRRPMAQ